jgi:hypothetical protein
LYAAALAASAQQSRRVRAARARAVASGRLPGARSAFGHRAVKTPNADGVLVASGLERVDAEADAIMRACAALQDGESLRTICARLAAEGFPLSPSALRRLLTSPRLAGLVRLGDDEVATTAIEPIITSEQLQMNRQLLSKRGSMDTSATPTREPTYIDLDAFRAALSRPPLDRPEGGEAATGPTLSP